MGLDPPHSLSCRCCCRLNSYCVTIRSVCPHWLGRGGAKCHQCARHTSAFGAAISLGEHREGAGRRLQMPCRRGSSVPDGKAKTTKQREVAMRRRDLLKYAGATALAAPFVRVARAEQGPVKVGVVGAKTGPLAPAAAGAFFPPWRLWAHEVNQASGLKLKDGARKVELIEYDDHTQPPEAIKAIERLATVDKA